MKSKRGFTLIELIVVIAIIGILTSIVLASLSTARGKGRDAARAGDIKQIQLALENYFTNNQAYPNCTGNATTCLTTSLTTGSNTYLTSIPTDPLNQGSYTYGYSSNGTSYCIGINLEVVNPSTLGTSASCTISSGWTATANAFYVAGP